jgi:hypothetical protein
LEIEGGVISGLVQQAIPAQAGEDYAMTSHSTTPDQPQSETETAVSSSERSEANAEALA